MPDIGAGARVRVKPLNGIAPPQSNIGGHYLQKNNSGNMTGILPLIFVNTGPYV